MDPNETLSEIRRLIADHRAGRGYSGTLEEVAELVTALDEWLAGGGFLPNGWAR